MAPVCPRCPGCHPVRLEKSFGEEAKMGPYTRVALGNCKVTLLADRTVNPRARVVRGGSTDLNVDVFWC